MKDLLNCPICDKSATEVCQIGVQRNIIGANNRKTNSVSAKCRNCGYKVNAQTTGRTTIIRDLWNVRDTQGE